MHWTDESKKAIIVDKKRKPKATLKKTRKPHKTPKPKNRSFFSAKTGKPNQTLTKSAKPKTPTSPS